MYMHEILGLQVQLFLLRNVILCDRIIFCECVCSVKWLSCYSVKSIGTFDTFVVVLALYSSTMGLK